MDIGMEPNGDCVGSAVGRVVNRHLPGARGDAFSSSSSAVGASRHNLGSRIIAHVDLDCFYVQVERSHNPELNNKPVAVVQYNPFGDLKSYGAHENRFKDSGSIIAVSYEARAKGVTRIMRGAEARKKCPEILLVQVPTSHGKADLQIYREASAKILKVLGERFPSVTIERASIDEVYLDVTTEASKTLQNSDPHTFIPESIAILRQIPTLIAGDDQTEVKMHKNQIRNGHAGTDFKVDSSIVGKSELFDEIRDWVADDSLESWFDRPAYMWSTEDRLLLAGALVIRQLRNDVFMKLGFTCSAGIAVNKMLAKLSSGMHKPNKQTLVPLTVIPKLMKDLPFSRVQGFGGKLGAEITSKFGDDCKTMNDLIAVGKYSLTQAFGEETATWILNRAQGIDHDPVQDRALPISIGCSKSFRSSNILLPTHFVDGTILRWLTELAMELIERLRVDTESNNRKAKQLHVGLSVLIRNKTEEVIAQSGTLTSSIEQRVSDWHAEQGLSLSKICRLPSSVTADGIAKLALNMVQKALSENPRLIQIQSTDKTWGITSLGLSANQFETVEKGKNSIVSFLQASTASTAIAIVNAKSNECEDMNLFDDGYCNSLLSDDFSLQEMQDSNLFPPADPVFAKKSEKAAVELSDSTPSSSTTPTKTHAKRLETTVSNPGLLASFRKYVKDVDLETFLSLPSDIQQELISNGMFQSHNTTNKKQKTSHAGNNKGSTSLFSSWLKK